MFEGLKDFLARSHPASDYQPAPVPRPERTTFLPPRYTAENPVAPLPVRFHDMRPPVAGDDRVVEQRAPRVDMQRFTVCPHCGSAEFADGVLNVSGGITRNIFCIVCGAGFNVHLIHGGPFFDAEIRPPTLDAAAMAPPADQVERAQPFADDAALAKDGRL